MSNLWLQATVTLFSSTATRLWSVTSVGTVVVGTLVWHVVARNAMWWSTVVILGSTGLLLAGVVASIVRRRHSSTEGVLILGTGLLAATVIEEIEAQPDGPYQLIGVVDDSVNGERVFGVTPVLGRLDQFSEIVAATRPARIVVAMADRRGRLPEGPLLESRLRGVIVEDAIDLCERLMGKLAIESLRPSSLILSKEFRQADYMRSPIRHALRSSLCRLCAAMGLAFGAPMLAVIAAAIKLDSRGPVFFVQDRVGRGGTPFGLIKFRTMRDHVRTGGSEWVSDNSDRITRVGKWLRRFRLDELPQLVNVVRGEMDIVGPRPHPVSNQQLFLDKIPYYGFRSMVRPGITGWAQVRYGYANNLEEETEKMRYDLYYIKHGSARLDGRIVLETLALLIFSDRSHEQARRRVPRRRWSNARLDAVS